MPLGSDATQRYIQQYTYDAVGNMLSLRHIADTGSYTRNYTIATDSNRMDATAVGSDSYSYSYDARGNLTVMPQLSNMAWNRQNELSRIEKGTMEAWYQYSGGQRVRKYVYKAGIKEERIYLGSFEIYRKFDASSLILVERHTVHISDDTGRIAMLEKRTYGIPKDDNETMPELERYIYSNHLQSASLELDEDADIISYEEYHPYGTTSYQAMSTSIAAVAKRYRYTGKERDEESGLYYHGARYYIPWLCRWTAVDPLESKYAGMSPYNYSFNNPIVFNDPSGMEGEEVAPKTQGQPIRVRAIDESGKEVPAGTTLPYDGLHKGKYNSTTDIFSKSENILTGDSNDGKLEAPAGSIYAITYKWMQWDGQKEGHYELANQGYEPIDKPFTEPKPEPKQPVALIEPTPIKETQPNIPRPVHNGIKIPVKPRTIPRPVQIPRPTPQILPPPPALRTVSSNTLIGGATWRADMSQQGYEYMLSMVKDLKGTNLGSINITFGIPSNMNLGAVVNSGEGREETINPRTNRVTDHAPMVNRPVQATGRMDVRNVELQGMELKNELQRRLKVPVNLNFIYDGSSNLIKFQFFPKIKK